MKRTLIGSLCLVAFTTSLTAATKPKPSSPSLVTVHDFTCADDGDNGQPCVLEPDPLGPYVGGDDNVVIELAQGQTYKMTIYGLTPRQVEVNLAGDGTCAESAPGGTLRFLRVDGIGSLTASGEAMLTTAYAQINGPDGAIWNLYWGANNTALVRVQRNGDGSWTINTTGDHQAFIEKPSGRRWAPCGTSKASFSLITRLQ
jgi:hypothetical protein